MEFWLDESMKRFAVIKSKNQLQRNAMEEFVIEILEIRAVFIWKGIAAFQLFFFNNGNNLRKSMILIYE